MDNEEILVLKIEADDMEYLLDSIPLIKEQIAQGYTKGICPHHQWELNTELNMEKRNSE